MQYMKQAVEYSQDRPDSDRQVSGRRIEVDVDALSEGRYRHRRHSCSTFEEAGNSFRRLVLGIAGGGHSEAQLSVMPDYTFKLARALKSRRPDEYPVCNPSRVGVGRVFDTVRPGQRPGPHDGNKVYGHRSEPARLATVPYVSKATACLAKIAARLMTGRKLRVFLPEFIERGADLDTGRCLLREVSSVSVVEISWRRYRSRPR